MKCIYCYHPYTYTLADEQRKCSSCRKKFSIKKLKKEAEILSYFIKGYVAKETANETRTDIRTVQKHYMKFREIIFKHCDKTYKKNLTHIDNHDAYLYLPYSLSIESHIDKLKHFHTSSYGNYVYNIIIPQSIEMQSEELNIKRKKKYQNFKKVAKIAKEKTTIREFWNFFEMFIVKYRGIEDKHFLLYLKEAEWRFNYRNSFTSKVDTFKELASVPMLYLHHLEENYKVEEALLSFQEEA